jgi:hypothetical protein
MTFPWEEALKRPPVILAACLIGLTACQPAPIAGVPTGALPGQVNPPGILTPPTTTPVGPITPPAREPVTPLTKLRAEVTVPAGAVVKLRSTLRTVATDDVTDHDLSKLVLNVGGTKLTQEQFSFSDLHYDPAGQLVANLNITNTTLMPGSVLSMATPSGNFVLKVIIPSSSSGITQIDVTSTARTLIAEKLFALGTPTDPTTIPAAAIALIEERLSSLLTSSLSSVVLEATRLMTAVDLLSSAVSSGKADDPATLTQILQAVGKVTSGGGGGIPDLPSAKAAAQLGLIPGTQAATDAEFVTGAKATTDFNMTHGAQAAIDAEFITGAKAAANLSMTRGSQAGADAEFATGAKATANFNMTRGTQAGTDAEFATGAKATANFNMTRGTQAGTDAEFATGAKATTNFSTIPGSQAAKDAEFATWNSATTNATAQLNASHGAQATKDAEFATGAKATATFSIIRGRQAGTGPGHEDVDADIF